MKLPELPELPEGDESKDPKVFRFLGRGGRYRKYECWEDAIRAYALAYGRAVQEECARVAEQCKEDFLAVRWANEVEWSGKTMAQEIAAAIRKQD